MYRIVANTLAHTSILTSLELLHCSSDAFPVGKGATQVDVSLLYCVALTNLVKKAKSTMHLYKQQYFVSHKSMPFLSQ